MTYRTPALQIPCPKCHAENVTPTQHHIWLVVDERGRHFECNVCGSDFQGEEVPFAVP
jgi:transcription elongation factor Elf1